MKFILNEHAITLAKNTGIEEKIKLLKHHDRFGNAVRLMHMQDDLKEQINDLAENGFYNQDIAYVSSLKEFMRRPKIMQWKQNTASPTILELQAGGEEYSIFILSGIPASYAFDTLPKFKDAGFDSFSEMLGTLGAYMRKCYEDEYDFKIDRWTGRVKDTPFLNLIENESHQDTYIHQYNLSVENIIDPFGNMVSYKPVTAIDHRMSKIDGAESSYLILMLKYADALGIHHEIAGQTEELEKTYDAVKASDPSDINFGSKLMDELVEINDDHVINSYSYCLKNDHAYLDSTGVLLIGYMDVKERRLLPKIRYTEEDILPAITGILRNNSHGGRTNPRELARILTIYRTEGFDKYQNRFNK